MRNLQKQHPLSSVERTIIVFIIGTRPLGGRRTTERGIARHFICDSQFCLKLGNLSPQAAEEGEMMRSNRWLLTILRRRACG